jgi:mannosyltransferase OCH1-like enzyme
MNLVITEKPPTICLNMIVKNESHIIANTLEKLCNKINFDYWVICDTGSTDNTPQIITDFFNNKGIQGELFYDEWTDFAHNRTLALQRAYKKTDLLLVFDADDEIVGNIIMPKNVSFDEYHLKFGTEVGVSYTRVLLINNHKKFQYFSVLHEYISCIEGPCTSTIIEGNYFVISGRSGNRNLDPNKYLKDALILEKAHEQALLNKDPLFHRYAYYCANSYKDCGKYEDAIKWYKITLGQKDQWSQEKYTSCLYIYDCYKALNQEELGFYYLVESFAYDTERVECLYPLLVHYCCKNMNIVAYNYYLIVKEFFENNYIDKNMNGKLFVNIDKFNFFVPYYMILIADKVKDFKCVIKMYEIVFIKKQKMISEWHIQNLLYNLQFFIQHIPPENTNFIKLADEYIRWLISLNVKVYNYDFINRDVYRNAGLIYDEFISKEITNKSQIFTKTDCMNSKNILIYTGFSNIHWNYSYMLNNALGGSEKAVAYITKCFPKDYNIFVSGDVANEQFDNIQYIHLSQLTNLINTTPFHTVIISRYIAFYEIFPNASFYQSFIWAHDICLLWYGSKLNDQQILTKWNKYITGCICLTEWHKNLFLNTYPQLCDKINIINNGIDLSSFKSVNIKIKNKFIYTSRPERGLDTLLKLWPQILDKIPDATLSIATYGEFPSNNMEYKLKQIMDSYSSIHFLGKLNTTKLYEEMNSTEFWLYPTNFNETSCITALEMLMNEVICIYYPVAGLINTIDKYGVQVQSGNEIETLVCLTDEQKITLRKNGRLYAETCSWDNRSKTWIDTLKISNNNINNNTNKNIAIFNSLSFHYEMYGYIIEYCKNNNYNLTIFTSTQNNLGWLDFYKSHFNTYSFNYKNIEQYESLQHTFDNIFITTDDDFNFKQEWINNKCIAIDHTCKNRRPQCKNHIGTRPFVNNNIKDNNKWAIPCFTIFQENEKTNLLINNINNINIAIIGGGDNYKYNYDVINRLYSNKHINLFIMAREAEIFSNTLLNTNFSVFKYNNIDTDKLIKIIQKCDYILIDCTYNIDHMNGVSMSGSIPLAFSTLTPLIISKSSNELYNFKNVIEFDINNNDSIIVYKNDLLIKNLNKERNELISLFEHHVNKIFNNVTHIPKQIIQTWEHKNISNNFQEIINLWKINNPNYDYNLFDKTDRIEFITEFFDETVVNAYNAIIPGAYKADLFRYCYLYIKGGVYIDIDSLSIGKLDDFLLNNIEFCVPIDLNISTIEGQYNLACGFIASVPKHPILLESINRIVYNINHNISYVSKLDFTGPGLLGRSTNKYLENNETNSFIGKEGIINNIHFLKFERDTEYIKDITNNILFQNKNGNPKIIELYNIECNKLANYVSWTTCKNNLQINLDHKHSNKKNIALTIYGQFRTYMNNLKYNIQMLTPLFKNNNIYVFVLSDKLPNGNYSKENEEEIKAIFKQFNFNICFFDYIENHSIIEENEFYNYFFENIKNKKGLDNPFVPKLIYRKFLLNTIKNEYINKNNIQIDIHISARLFDIIINNNKSFETIETELNKLYTENEYIYGSCDTIFISQQSGINYLFDLPNYYKSNKIYGDEIWEDESFTQFVYNIDSVLCICRATYSPEIQYIAHIYFSSLFKYKNIRFDFNNSNSTYNTDTLYHILLDPNRQNISANNPKIINLTSSYINYINKQINPSFFKYYSYQGLIDYNMGIGNEHYKLLCCLSTQITNSNIFDIGAHNGNSAVSIGYSSIYNNNKIYSFDIKNLIDPACKQFFTDHSVYYYLEDIFDVNIREKYSKLLLESSFIMIDIDPHNGILEYQMYEWLKDNNYNGLILYDDIFLEKGRIANGYEKTTHNMIDFWNKIPDKYKLNLTNVGHWSGTGLVCFNTEKYTFILDN